ncbi:MAG: hypothetical protein AAFR17_16095 [Pseudomonadota bacterium]
MDTRFDLQDLDFDTAYRIAHKRAAETRSAEVAAFFSDIAKSIRGLFSRSETTGKAKA